MAKVVAGRTLLTVSDYLRFPDDGRRHELIDGEHHVTPSPATRHQVISGRLFVQLHDQLATPGHGEVFHAPTDVVLSDTDVVQPDLFVVLAANRRIITPENVQGAPDLVIEIASPSTAEYDAGPKRRLYEKYRVEEYWIVRTGDDTVERLVLEAGGYVSRGAERDRVEYDGVAGVTVDLSRVW